MSGPPTELVRTLGRARRIFVAAHVYPDGDALGSLLALAESLEAMGKEVYRYSEEEASHLYDFLPGSGRLRTAVPVDLTAFDCAVALDCGDRYRLGREMERLLAIRPFLVIDHHAGHTPFGDLAWVDPERAATGEMVYDLIQALGGEVSATAAYCLYAAIVSDTGSFKYSSTSAETFRVAQELVERGVKPSEVAGRLFDNYTVARLHLLTAVLETLELHAGNRIALISVSRELFAQTGASQADTENFINYPRALASVQVAAFIKEAPDDLISVSLRSKGIRHDVAAVAARFGGGGHRNAAGFKLAGETVAGVREKLLPALADLVGEEA
ncbi:MAG: bifunctional oligoribonuclease/PAP phosphatase NrnA [Deltaproteobacteria bacterium]|jgi:phosphoesterase RecJ-like protein